MHKKSNMKRIRLITILFLPALLTLSCKKFIDVKPKGLIIAENVGDFEAILNDVTILNPFGQNNPLIYPTDDLTEPGLLPQNQTSPKGNMYFWREYINGANDRPDMWYHMYNSIANLNVITEGVLEAKDGTAQKKKQLYAEALLSKVYNYQHLLSFFAPAYDKATAASQYGVPYVTTTDVSKPAPPRPSLEESYATMIRDLHAALPDLPEQNSNLTRATKNAAYGMLSRIYLSMGDYDKAMAYADSVLNSGAATIEDYNHYVGDVLPGTNSSPEELWVRYSNNGIFRYSANLLSKYEVDKDLRIAFFARLNGGVYSYGGGNTSYNPNRGITYAEIFLNKAECLARSGDVAGALDIVNNEIRSKRFDPADFTPLKAATKEEALNAVLEERRRELAFKGVRWSDMKRLDADDRMPAVKRYATDGATVLETLEPHSTKYTFQIPLQVQAFNADMPLNQR